eukprot:6321060-Amphidinium_carterae.1
MEKRGRRSDVKMDQKLHAALFRSSLGFQEINQKAKVKEKNSQLLKENKTRCPGGRKHTKTREEKEKNLQPRRGA